MQFSFVPGQGGLAVDGALLVLGGVLFDVLGVDHDRGQRIRLGGLLDYQGRLTAADGSRLGATVNIVSVVVALCVFLHLI